MKMRNSGLALWLSAVLVIQCHSVSVASSPEEELRFPSDVYSRILINCQDKLDAWNSDVTHTSGGPLSYSLSDVFVRGRWWRQKGGDGEDEESSNSSPSSEFLRSSSEGKFDFFSSGINASRGGIQNFSASIFTLNARERPRGPILEAHGLLNVDTGEVCLVACSRTLLAELESISTRTSETNISTAEVPAGTPAVDDEAGSFLAQDGDEDCSIRGALIFLAGKDEHHLKMEGTLENMRNSSDPEWFVPIHISGKIINDMDQRALYRQKVFVNSGLYSTEAGIIIWQIVYSLKSSSGYFVSVLGIFVQVVVQSLIAARFLYIPLRLLTYREFKYLFTNLALIPSVLGLLLIILNSLFLSFILRKRRMARRTNISDIPQELRLASVCIVLYGIIGGLLWWVENFTTYLQVVWCCFLLPQVVANVFWDLRTKPLHPVYGIGLSLCRITFIGYDSLRPTIYGYDDISDFPQGWFWGITLTVIFLLVYSLMQQRYGGRCFLPQRWFGYQRLSHPHNRVTQRQSSSSPDDQMFNL